MMSKIERDLNKMDLDAWLNGDTKISCKMPGLDNEHKKNNAAFSESKLKVAQDKRKRL